jgi:hypothetical protein
VMDNYPDHINVDGLRFGSFPHERSILSLRKGLGEKEKEAQRPVVTQAAPSRPLR